jgi:hypothetical protein
VLRHNESYLEKLPNLHTIFILTHATKKLNVLNYQATKAGYLVGIKRLLVTL